MTVIPLQAESAPANPTPTEILYRAWRYAKAQWDLADYDPANTEELADHERDAYCTAEHSALIALFLEPASTKSDLARKMRTLVVVQGWEFNDCSAIMRRMQRDVHAFAFGFDPGED